MRSPDPAANPYLALALMLRAGLDGIEKKMALPDPIDRNIYIMTDEERLESGIPSLPESLKQAIDELLQNDVILRCDGRSCARSLPGVEGNRVRHVPDASPSMGTRPVYDFVLK